MMPDATIVSTSEAGARSLGSVAVVSARPGGIPRSHRWALAIAWIACGALLLIGLGRHSVERTQEARVLVTARGMYAGDLHAWLVPHVNGRLRLQKPPLAYWLSALSFKAFGVDEWSGRLPAAIAGWLTVGVTFHCASRLFGVRAGFLSAAAVAGSFMFYRHTRLAETDALVLLFGTVASYAFIRASSATAGFATGPDATAQPKHVPGARWLYAGAGAVGMVAVSKGLPALFPLLFLTGLGLVRRDWSIARRFFTSGAFLLGFLVAVPWFAFAVAKFGTNVFLSEAVIAAAGAGHRGWFIEYVPELMAATAPWSAFVVAALWVAVERRRDPRVVALLLWIASILVPLFLAGQKQIHYLLPVLPPLMILVGWLLDQAFALPADVRLLKWITGLLIGTTALFGAGLLALPEIARRTRGELAWEDTVVAVAAGVGVAVVLAALAGGVRRALLAFACLALPIVAIAVGHWAPTLTANTSREAAAAILREARGEAVCFFGRSDDLPLSFALGRETPLYTTEDDLLSAVEEEPETLVLRKTDGRSPRMPRGFKKVATVKLTDEAVTVFQKPPTAPAVRNPRLSSGD